MSVVTLCPYLGVSVFCLLFLGCSPGSQQDDVCVKAGEPGMVGNTFNPSTLEATAGGSL